MYSQFHKNCHIKFFNKKQKLVSQKNKKSILMTITADTYSLYMSAALYKILNFFKMI